MSKLSRRKVLFVGEGATLAHAARPMALAAALPSERFEAILAVPERYRRWAPPHLAWRPLEAQSPETFAARVRTGRQLFSASRLRDYLAHDLQLLADVAPEVVVGDFRFSLAASARQAGIPYINISNAYWSPDRPLRPARPTLDLFDRWPAPLAEAAFRLVLPHALRWHAKPVEQLLADAGLDGIGGDVRRAFTEADLTLYADIPALFPDLEDGPGRRFLGPVAWEPPAPASAGWKEAARGREAAYLSLGSSGDARRVGAVAEWLEACGFFVLIATAGAVGPEPGPNRLVADYLPGALAAAASSVVVCNGGSPSATQALLAGRPVIGICSNMDQFLNMQAVAAQGAGVLLRADALRERAFIEAVERVRSPSCAEAALRLGASGHQLDPTAVLTRAIESLASSRR